MPYQLYKKKQNVQNKAYFPKKYSQLTNKPCFLQYRTYFLMNNNCLNEPNVWCIYCQLVNSELSTVGQRMELPEYTSFLSDTLYGCREQKFQSFSIQGARSRNSNTEISNPGASGAFCFNHGSLLPKLKITGAKCQNREHIF